MDEASFGRDLRQATERIVKAAVDARLAAYGADVERWAERAASRSVAQAALAAVQPGLDGLAALRATVAGLEKALAAHAGVLGRLDHARLQGDYAEIEASQARLEKLRDGFIAELQLAQVNVAKAAQAAAEARDDAVASATRAELAGDNLRGDMAKAATGAADARIADALAGLDAFVAVCRTAVAAEIAKIDGRVAQATRAARIQNLADAWRGAWDEAAIYKRGDLVIWRGSTYMAVESAGNGPPGKPDGPWVVIAGR